MTTDRFPVVQAYLAGTLYVEISKAVESLDTVYSTQRAADLAAAKVWKAFMAEYEALDKAYFTPHTPLADKQLFDELCCRDDDLPTVQAALIGITGSRTLLADLDYV